VTSFPEAARVELANVQLRTNLRNATDTIRAKRTKVVDELPDWEELREAGKAIKTDVLANLDEYLLQFERAVITAGGHVHWARDAAEANAAVANVARTHGVDKVVKVKSLTTDEIGLNAALAEVGIHALETDFAELILQLDGDWSSAHPRTGDPPQSNRDPRPLCTDDRPRNHVRRPAQPRGGRAHLSSRAVPGRARSASVVPTSASLRQARSASSSPRETAGCARRCRLCS